MTGKTQPSSIQSNRHERPHSGFERITDVAGTALKPEAVGRGATNMCSDGGWAETFKSLQHIVVCRDGVCGLRCVTEVLVRSFLQEFLSSTGTTDKSGADVAASACVAPSPPDPPHSGFLNRKARVELTELVSSGFLHRKHEVKTKNLSSSGFLQRVFAEKCDFCNREHNSFI